MDLKLLIHHVRPGQEVYREDKRFGSREESFLSYCWKQKYWLACFAMQVVSRGRAKGYCSVCYQVVEQERERYGTSECKSSPRADSQVSRSFWSVNNELEHAGQFNPARLRITGCSVFSAPPDRSTHERDQELGNEMA